MKLHAKGRNLSPNSQLFVDSDLDGITNIICRLFRSMCIYNKITVGQFRKMHQNHLREMGSERSTYSHRWGNMRKAIDSDTMTFAMFLGIITNILRWRLKKVKIVIEKEDGEEQTFEVF